MPAIPAFRSAVFLSVFVVLALPGCTRSYQVVEVPQYGADLYPTSQTRSGVTVAIDEIRTADRAKRYFGVNLIREGILPVNVVVSNYGKQRVAVKPSDIVLSSWKDIMDPVPLELVVAAAKREHGRLPSSGEAQLGKFFRGAAFREAVVLPNETYSGVVFFALPPPQRHMEGWFRTVSTYGTGMSRIQVGVTGLDGGERMRFGPFIVTLPEE